MTWNLAGVITQSPTLSLIVGIGIAVLAVMGLGVGLFSIYMCSGIGPGCPGGVQIRHDDQPANRGRIQ